VVYREGPTPAGSCPRCRETLEPREGVDAKVCPTCGGVFAGLEASQRIVRAFDRALMGVAFEASLGKAKPRDSGMPVSCPECLLAMQKIRIESAACEVDACPAHGTWFDTHELEHVIRAYEAFRRRGGRAAPPTPARAPMVPPRESPRDASLVDQLVDAMFSDS